MTANPIVDVADALRLVALTGLAGAERPSVLEEFHHHFPFVPQTQCCTAAADEEDYPFGRDGFLTTSVQNAFGSQRFPAPSNDPDGPNPPAATFGLRLWRCFTMIDKGGNYDTAAASARSEALAQDLAAIWAALDQATRCGSEAGAALLAVVNGCKRVVLTDARPIRAQGGCAGWDFTVTASWLPLQFPPPEEP